MGDLNARSTLLWSGESRENSAGKLFFEILTFENMEQLIYEPTHFPNDEVETSLGLLIASNASSIVDHGGLPSLDTHCKRQIIHAKINFHVPLPLNISIKIWIMRPVIH